MFENGLGNGLHFVAEISSNHNGSIKTALDLVEAAAYAGADSVKVQAYTADGITLSSRAPMFVVGEAPWKGQSLYELYSRAATPYEWLEKIRGHCHRFGIGFFSSVFDECGADFLEGLGTGAFKISSFELVHLPLLRHVARKGRVVILSCGMASAAEIDEAVEAMLAEGLPRRKLALLKCTSAYPATPQDMNLRTLADMKRRWNCSVGLSDHSMNSTAAITAAALGASIIEKHLCLSRGLQTPDSSFSLEPEEFAQMVQSVREAQQALGHIRYGASPGEATSLRRSIFITEDMRAGEILSNHNTRVIRPGNGLAPKHLEHVLGRRISTDVPGGTPLSWDLVGDIHEN